MNPHQESQIKNIQKAVICSHDRLNENDDTSNFSVEMGQQITDISDFKLVSAMVPLSSYTFNKDDDDRTFEITTAERAARIRNTSTTTPYFLNFAYYTRPFSPYGYGTFSPYEMLRIRLDGQFIQTMDGGQSGSIALRIFNEVSEANAASYLVLYNQNSTVNYATIAQNLQNHCAGTGSLPGYDLTGLRFRDNWQSPYNENADAQNEFGAQTVFSHPDPNDPSRDVIYFYNKKANQDFTVSIGWFSFNSITSKYDIPIQGGSVFVNMNGISTKTSIGHYIYGIRPPSEGGWSNYKTKLVGFFNTIYTNDSLVSHLNSQMSDYDISFSKTQISDIVGLDKLVLNAPASLNTGYRRIDSVNGDVICMRRLGYRFNVIFPTPVLKNAGFIGPWENIVSTVQPLEPINIYYEIKCPIIQVNGPNTPNVLPETGTSTGTHLFSDLIQQDQFKKTNSWDYPNMNINLELVNDPNAINPGYYSLKMSSPDTSCRRLELRIDQKLRQFYIPTEGDYYYKLAAGEPYNTSTVAGGLLFQPYFSPPLSQTIIEKNIWWPNNLPSTYTVSFSSDIMYTEAELLSDIQIITTSVPNLLFSIVQHKLKIQNTSENTGFILGANERLGIPVDTYLAPLSTYTGVELIDISSLNDVIYIALPDLYQDGKNSYNSFKNLTSDPSHQRPIISSIVCSIWNNSDVQYGKYVSYNNQADSWMRSTRKDLKTLRVMILDSEYRIIDLNKKAVHLEIDFR